MTEGRLNLEVKNLIEENFIFDYLIKALKQPPTFKKKANFYIKKNWQAFLDGTIFFYKISRFYNVTFQRYFIHNQTHNFFWTIRDLKTCFGVTFMWDPEYPED